MPVPLGSTKDAETIARLKEEYLEYYEDCPKQVLAAQYIMRDTTTISRWKSEDENFANMVLRAEARFARKHVKNTNADWKLSRMFPQHFREPEKNITVTQVIPILGDMNVHTNDSNQEDSGTQQAD